MLRNMIRTFRFKFWRARVEALALLALAFSMVRARSYVRSMWTDPTGELGPRVAVFVHFDRYGEVRPYVRQYLAELRVCGFAVVFVTNSGELGDEDAAFLRTLCHAVIIRRNVGYDFGAMRDALEAVGLPRVETEQVLLVNDSVYGPLRPLGEMLSRVDMQAADMWGATDSWQNRYHLQSFFLLVGRTVLHSAAWAAFWGQLRHVGSKHYVVMRYEVGLTQKMLRAGHRCAALWPYERLVGDVDAKQITAESKTDPVANARTLQAMRIRYAVSDQMPLNPTAELWRQLLRAGCPFIKRELLRSNPAGVADLSDWRVLLTQLGMDRALIEQDLKRVLKHRAP